ncbi:Heterokaryon incompatibility protein (HET) domain containing protein [Naviculisporaceae sp. PSN 640]
MIRGFSLLDEEWIPKTFSDAMTVAHRLRIPYIWIDSLCIIQDDPGDWAVESSRMADVYSNAYLTISAACSPSDEFGFLHPRQFQYATLKLISPRGEAAVAYLREEGQVGPRFWIKDEPLFRRAWAFQEQFLSRRTLIFFKTEMAFYCRSPQEPDSSFIRTESNTTEARAAVERNFMSVNNLSWRSIARDLSTRLLTYDSDKLPCIAGVASTFSTARDGTRKQYCAGIWRDSLPTDLLFCRGEKVERARGYTAPSWSWAALNGPIVWLGKDGEVNKSDDIPTEYETIMALDSIRIISCNIILEDERSPYGKVREGSSLTMLAQFIELQRCREEESEQGPDIPAMPSWQFEPRYLQPEKARKVMGEVFKFFSDGVERFVWCRFGLFSLGLKDIIAVPVAFRRWGFEESLEGQSPSDLQETDALVGILVTPMSGNGPRDGYRRVGVFELPSAGHDPVQTLGSLPSKTFVLY